MILATTICMATDAIASRLVSSRPLPLASHSNRSNGRQFDSASAHVTSEGQVAMEVFSRRSLELAIHESDVFLRAFWERLRHSEHVSDL